MTLHLDTFLLALAAIAATMLPDPYRKTILMDFAPN